MNCAFPPLLPPPARFNHSPEETPTAAKSLRAESGNATVMEDQKLSSVALLPKDELGSGGKHPGKNCNQNELNFRSVEDLFNYLNVLDGEIWKEKLPLILKKINDLKYQPYLEPARDVRDCPENQMIQKKMTTSDLIKAWMKNRVLCAITVLPAVLFLVFIALFLASLNKTCPSGDAPLPRSLPPCPPHWFLYQGTCYFFSEGMKDWTSSQSFCSSYNASLAKITDEEKDFMHLLKGRDTYWIGLKRSPGQPWKWLDGENATLEGLEGGGNCAYFNHEFRASSARCSIPFRWICSKAT